MHISKIRTLSETGGKAMLEMLIKIEHSPAEALIVYEALKSFPGKIKSNPSLQIVTDDNVATIKFSLNTDELPEAEVNHLVGKWIEELNSSLGEKHHLLPLMEEAIRLKNEIKNLFRQVKILENEIREIKQVLIRKKFIKEEL